MPTRCELQLQAQVDQLDSENRELIEQLAELGSDVGRLLNVARELTERADGLERRIA